MKVYVIFETLASGEDNKREIDRVFLNKEDARLYVVTEEMAYNSKGDSWKQEADKLFEEHEVIEKL